MAEDRDDADKTEEPSQRRLEEALKRGDVAKSQEVNTWFVLAGGALVLLVSAGPMSAALTRMLAGVLANLHQIPADGGGLLRLSGQLGGQVLAALAVPFLLLMLAALAGNVVQHKFVWSGEQLKPKLSKISLASGARRLFSKQAIAGFVKGLVKLFIIGWLMAAVLWPERRRLDALVAVEPLVALQVAYSLALAAIGAVVAALAIVAALDYLWQYRQWFERQKMSLRELKEEYKHSEGDPAIKAKIKQIRQNRMKKRMMAAVPQASVVITNPTHFAVALKYERGMNAPLCLAKGVDAVAFRIREVAKEHEIPIVENPPLARALHATVDIDQEIPAEHYKAVAEVISYVMRVRQRVRA